MGKQSDDRDDRIDRNSRRSGLAATSLARTEPDILPVVRVGDPLPDALCGNLLQRDQPAFGFQLQP